MHRLDRDTSGCLLVARRAQRAAHAACADARGAFEKRYLALVKGHWQLGTQAHRCAAAHRHARRRGAHGARACLGQGVGERIFSRCSSSASVATLMEVNLHTGRTHQIRVHAAHAGHRSPATRSTAMRDFNSELQRARPQAHVPARAQRQLRLAAGRRLSAPARRCRRILRGARSARIAPQARAGGSSVTARQAREPQAPPGAVPASQISGRPISAVGSSLSMRSNSAMPRPSALKPPAQSKGCSRRDVALDLGIIQVSEDHRGAYRGVGGARAARASTAQAVRNSARRPESAASWRDSARHRPACRAPLCRRRRPDRCR